MPHLPFHLDQLEFMRTFAENRPVWLDPFFKFLHYFDSPYFFYVLIPTIWLGVSYRWGIRIFYWLTVNSMLNGFFKNLFAWPRPSTDVTEIGLYHPKSFGFPSGGAQGAMFLGLILMYYWRTKASYIIGSIYILLISFSRIYLGVHYPIDVLGGWVVAILLFLIFIKAKEPLEHWLKKIGLKATFVLSVFLPVAFMVLFPTKSIFFIMGSSIGIGAGTHLSLKYHLFLPNPHSFKEAAIRSFFGISLLFLVIFLLPFEKNCISSMIPSFFMSFVASPFIRSLIRTKKI